MTLLLLSALFMRNVWINMNFLSNFDHMLIFVKEWYLYVSKCIKQSEIDLVLFVTMLPINKLRI